MVGTIVPVVHGDPTARRWVPLMAHVMGGLTGGAVVGAAVASLGSATYGRASPGVTGVTPVLATGGLALVLAAGEAGLVRIPTPQLRRQVSQRRRRHMRPWMTAWLFGAELGGGLTTFVPVTTFYVLLMGAFLSAEPVLGAVVMAAFGVSRTAPVAFIAATTRDAAAAATSADALLGWDPLVHLANALTLALAGAYLLSSSTSVP